MVPYVVGIDFGTIACVACLCRNDMVFITDDTGSTDFYSLVSINENGLQTGSHASDMKTNNELVIENCKLLIGKLYSSLPHDKDVETFGMKLSRSQDRYCCFNVQDQSYSVEDVLVALLKHIKEKTDEVANTSVEDVVISVPVTFSVLQRTILKNACQKAGWNHISLLNEPTATLLGIKCDYDVSDMTMIIDCGETSLRVTILYQEDEKVRIVASSEDKSISGKSIDKALLDIVANRYYQDQHERLLPPHTEYSREMKFLMKEIRRVKQTLSMNKKSDVHILQSHKNVIITVTRKELDSSIHSMMESLQGIIHETLESGVEKLQIKDIGTVILMGRSTNLPFFYTTVSSIFPSDRIIKTNDKKNEIAKGCAICGNQQLSPDYPVIDKLRYTIGIELNDFTVYPIFHAGSSIPCKKTLSFSSGMIGCNSFKSRLVEVQGIEEEKIRILKVLRSQEFMCNHGEQKEFLFTFSINQRGVIEIVVSTYPGFQECMNIRVNVISVVY